MVDGHSLGNTIGFFSYFCKLKKNPTMDIEDKTENEPMDEQPMDETMEGVEDAQAQEDEYHVIPLKGMFENWFLDYAS